VDTSQLGAVSPSQGWDSLSEVCTGKSQAREELLAGARVKQRLQPGPVAALLCGFRKVCVALFLL
jgi:hypothetical protein